MKSSILLPVPKYFSFSSAVFSHGWCDLLPFAVQKNPLRLETVLALPKSTIATVTMCAAEGGIAVAAESDQLFNTDEILVILSSMFRLDEPLDQFYTAARKHPQFSWIPRKGAGRLLRSQTVFEDLIKTICTTNCSWHLTRVMVRSMTKKLGTSAGNGRFLFPNAEQLAATNDKFMRTEIRCGYRAPYILQCAEEAASGKRDVELWRTTDIDSERLYKELRCVKGVGDYAAGSLMKLLGRYDKLGIDSWCRAKYSEIHGRGRKTSDSTIGKFYRRFGKWQGLFLWMDLTQHWYKEKFPF